MLYLYDLRKILRRYSPVWFRWPENQGMAFALCCWLERVAATFMGLRAEVALEYRYCGLKHSLEWLCNDLFDPTLRRIYITVPEQLPVLRYQDDGDVPVAYHGDDGDIASYHHLNNAELNAAGTYRYEFLVNVQVGIPVDTDKLFQQLDIYRYAGRRPAIRFFIPGINSTVQFVYYNG